MDTTITTIAPPRLDITEAELCTWLGTAAPGDQLVYHRGFLAIDCAPTNDGLAKREREELRRVARRVRGWADDGLVHLIQRRDGPDDFGYMLVVRPRRIAAESALEKVAS
jgi:hypothetical protein